MLSPVYSEEDHAWYVVDRGFWHEFKSAEEAWAWIGRRNTPAGGSPASPSTLERES